MNRSMIVTVTMNPAIDKTVDMESFIQGGLNRIQKVATDAGGKGINVSKTIKALGGQTVAVSLGKDGAIFISGASAVRIPGLHVKAHSTVGAGDAMVAALSYGIDSKMNMEERIRLAAAASAGAVMTIGTKPPSRDLVEELKKQVKMVRL